MAKLGIGLEWGSRVLEFESLHSEHENRKGMCSFGFHGPSVEIRTRGLLNPIQARYQTSPHPDILFAALLTALISYHRFIENASIFFVFFKNILSYFCLAHDSDSQQKSP